MNAHWKVMQLERQVLRSCGWWHPNLNRRLKRISMNMFHLPIDVWLRSWRSCDASIMICRAFYEYTFWLQTKIALLQDQVNVASDDNNQRREPSLTFGWFASLSWILSLSSSLDWPVQCSLIIVFFSQHFLVQTNNSQQVESGVQMRKTPHTQLALRRRTVSNRLSRLQVNPYKPLGTSATGNGYYQLSSVQEHEAAQQDLGNGYVETDADFDSSSPNLNSPTYTAPKVLNHSIFCHPAKSDGSTEFHRLKPIVATKPEVQLLNELRNQQKMRNTTLSNWKQLIIFLLT